MILSKKKRHNIIKSVIENNEISSQHDLQKELAKRGIHVQQPTLSRDLREMAVIKTPKGIGRFIYRIKPDIEVVNIEEFKHKFINLVHEIKSTDNLVIIKTPPGEAQAVAKVVDNTGMKEILGTVAGDDTIIIVVDRKQNVKRVLKTFEDIRKNKK